MQGYPHFHRPIDHVVVGHDVSVRGDDYTAADAMLDLPLAVSLTRHTMAELLAESGAEELGERIVSPAFTLTFSPEPAVPARARSRQY